MISIRRWRKLFKTSYTIAHNISYSQFYITGLCYKYHSLSSKIKIPIHIYLLRNVNTLNYNNYVTDVQSIQLKENLLDESICNHTVNLKTVISIIEDLENNVHDIPGTLSLKLLQCCGHVLYNEPIQKRQKLANHVWDLLKNSCNLTIDHYNALLQTYIDNDYHIDAKEFLKSMKIKPEYDTYCLLLQTLPNTTDCAVIESLISDIQKTDSHYDNKIYNALVYAYAINGNTRKAKDVIELMKQHNIQPSPTTYIHLMYAYAKNNDIKSLTDILLTHKPSRAHIMKLIKFLSLSGHGIHIPDILACLEPLMVADHSVIAIIVQLVHAGHYLDAYNVITHIPIKKEVQCIKDIFALYLLEEMIKLNIDQKIILQFINDFTTEQQNSDIWKKTALLSLKRKNETLTVHIFNEMKEKGISFSCDHFWPYFLEENVHDRECHIYSIIKQMTALDVEIDSKTFIDYIFPYIDTSDPIVTVRKIANSGVPIGNILKPFVQFLINSHRLKDSTIICPFFKKKIPCDDFLDSLYISYTKSRDIDSCISLLFNSSSNGTGFAPSFLRKLLDAPTHSAKLNDLTTFVEEMAKYKTAIGPSELKGIQKRIIENNFSNSISILQLLSTMAASGRVNYNSYDFIHPQFMNPEQLYMYFIELKTNKKNYRGILRKLVMIFCNNNDPRMNEMIQEYNKKGFGWTKGMKLCLLDYYVRNKMIDEALLLLGEIQSQFPQFPIDNFKIIRLATLLIEYNKIDEALNLLNKSCVNHKHNINHAIKILLNLLITKDSCHYTAKVIDVLVQQEYCKNIYHVLKYLVLVDIFRDNMKVAIDTFIFCVEKFKRTPARQELLIEILKSNSEQNGDFLSNVYDLIVKVNGEEIANANLAIAYSACNKVKELQQLLKKCCIRKDVWLKQFQYLEDDMIISVTLKMLECVEDTTKLNLESVCLLALKRCDEQNDYERAWELQKWMKRKI